MTGGSLVAFETAYAAAFACAPPRAIERVALEDACGRTLARTVLAPDDLLPYARAAMDGYAVLASQTSHGARFSVVGSTFAGDDVRRSLALRDATAIAIATGAPLPHACDAVVPHEDVVRENGYVRLAQPVDAGENVFPAREDARRGDALVAAGRRLGPGALGLLAAAGIAHVDVYRAPRLALVSTGNELVGVGDVPRVGQVRDSNALALAAFARESGAAVVAVRVERDDRESLARTLASALSDADVVVTTGGASVGERDYVKAACVALGTTFAFASVAMRPSKPTAIGRAGDAMVAVLPGNPASAFAAFATLVRPALRHARGEDADRDRVEVTTTAPLSRSPQRTSLVFATIRMGADGFAATPIARQSSSLTRTASEASALVEVAPGGRRRRGGRLRARARVRVGRPVCVDTRVRP